MNEQRYQYIWRSAVTGKFVKKEYALKHPDKCVREAIKKVR